MAELFALIDNDDVQMVSQWETLERQPDFMQIENEITCALQVFEHHHVVDENGWGTPERHSFWTTSISVFPKSHKQ